MPKTYLIGCMLLTITTPSLACSEANILNTVYKNESAVLLQNAPTFRHGWEDKAIQLSFNKAMIKNGNCVAQMTLILPQNDIDDANNYANSNSARRTNTTSQGNTILDKTTIIDYFYKPDGTDLNKNNSALLSLHKNLLIMYQTIALQSVILKRSKQKPPAWTELDQQKETQYCMQNFTLIVGNQAFACDCRINNLARIISSRQMELIHYVSQQNSFESSEALISYQKASVLINDDCSELTAK